MLQSLALQSTFSLFAASLFLLQFLLTRPALCSDQSLAAVQPVSNVDITSIQLTKESLDSFTARLTGGFTDPRSVRLPADLAEEASNAKLWMRYIVGSVAVFGRVDRCALDVIHGFWSHARARCLPELLVELVKKNDCDTVVYFIAKNAVECFWDTELGYLIAGLVYNDWNAMRPLFEKVLGVLRESKDKSKEYMCILKCMPIGFQYGIISSGQVCLDEIDKVYLSDKPPHSLLREIFFRARCSNDPNPQIREYIAERAPWFKQFMPDASKEASDTSATSSVEPSHDVWTRIRSFMDAETLIFVWPLVCRAWNKSYSKVLAVDMRISGWFLQDLGHVSRRNIHTIAPWSHFLNEANSAVYLGQCILSGALGRAELDDGSNWEIRGYLQDTISGQASIPQAGREGIRHESFARLIEEGYKAYRCKMPTLCKPPLLTDEEHEKVIHHLVCQKKLVVKIDDRWIINNISRIYSAFGEDQGMIREVIELSTYDHQEAMFIWIMIGQVCGITEETARLVFDKPGTVIEKLIKPVVIKPSGYYDFIADSGMLFEMVKTHYEHIAHRAPWLPCSTYQLSGLMASLILFFKEKPDKIEQIVASVTSQLPTLDRRILERVKDRFGRGTVDMLAGNRKDVKFVKEVLIRCGLLNRVTA